MDGVDGWGRLTGDAAVTRTEFTREQRGAGDSVSVVQVVRR